MWSCEKQIGKIKKLLSAIVDKSIYKVSLEGIDNFVSLKSNIEKIDKNDINLSHFYKAVSIIAIYNEELDKRARIDFLLKYFRELGYFALSSFDLDYIYVFDINSESLSQEINNLDHLAERYFYAHVTNSIVQKNIFLNDINRNIKNAEDFWVSQQGEWIENFLEHLGDEISKDSFICYLNQRISAFILDKSNICYPVIPPRATKAWREQRINMSLELPKLQDIDGKVLPNTHFYYVYVLEQYRLSNKCEVLKGDCVADIGAFVGDTALYFSKLTGETGKVYSFEISPYNVSTGITNMKNNGISNVEFVQKAISDRTGILNFNFSDNSSMNSISDISTGSDRVESISIDDFCRQNNCNFDFIKADIEGSEMAMLRGAKDLIKNHHPKLAICLYHKRDDFFEIPNYIHSLCDKYKFFFRCEAEPVLFASVQ